MLLVGFLGLSTTFLGTYSYLVHESITCITITYYYYITSIDRGKPSGSSSLWRSWTKCSMTNWQEQLFIQLIVDIVTMKETKINNLLFCKWWIKWDVQKAGRIDDGIEENDVSWFQTIERGMHTRYEMGVVRDDICRKMATHCNWQIYFDVVSFGRAIS